MDQSTNSRSPLQRAPWGGGVKRFEVARLPTYTEGAAIDHDGNVYVSHAGRISKVTPQGEVTPWAQTPSPNGHKVRADGSHLVCDRKGAVYLLDPGGRVLRVAAEAPLGANDLTLDTVHGGFYFTSPYGSEEQSIGQIYYVDAQERATVAADSLDFPNGIVLRPDGKTLLVGESTQNRILEFPVEAPGKLGTPRVFAIMPYRDRFDPKKHFDGPMPDGMALDRAGNLYVAHYGAGQIQVFGTRGERLGWLPGSGKFTSNLAFGHDGEKQLYVSGSVGPTQQEIGLLVRLDLG